MSALPFPCRLSLNHRRATSRPVRAANCNDLLTSIIICLCYGLTASQVDSLDRALSRPFPRAQQAAESRIESSLRDTLPACSSQLSAGVKLVEKRSHRRAPTCSRARCVGDPVPGTSVVPRRAQLHTRLRSGLFGFGAAGGGQQRALVSSRSRSLARYKAGPANDVHVCRPRGVLWRRECPKIHCSERLCRASRRGSGRRVE